MNRKEFIQLMGDGLNKMAKDMIDSNDTDLAMDVLDIRGRLFGLNNRMASCAVDKVEFVMEDKK